MKVTKQQAAKVDAQMAVPTRDAFLAARAARLAKERAERQAEKAQAAKLGIDLKSLATSELPEDAAHGSIVRCWYNDEDSLIHLTIKPGDGTLKTAKGDGTYIVNVTSRGATLTVENIGENGESAELRTGGFYLLAK